MDAGQAVHPGEDTERDRRVRRTVRAAGHTAVPERRPVQLRGHEDHVAGAFRHVQRAPVHHTEAVRAVVQPQEGVQPRGQVHAGRGKEHIGGEHLRAEAETGRAAGRRQRRPGPMGKREGVRREHGIGRQKQRYFGIERPERQPNGGESFERTGIDENAGNQTGRTED